MINTIFSTLIATYMIGWLAANSDGGFNLPSTGEVSLADGLEGALHKEHDAIMNAKPLFTDAAIDAAPTIVHPKPLPRGWIAGDHNLPTAAEVDALAVHRKRHYYSWCCAALAKALQDGELVVSDNWRTIYLVAYNPMPEAQNAEERYLQAAASMAFAGHCSMKVVSSTENVGRGVPVMKGSK